MILMGLDYGAHTVGVAVNDALGLTAQPLETVFREREDKLRRTYARIQELAREHGVEAFVVGLPLHMDGSEGERSAKARAFGEGLARRTQLPVSYCDERLTTVECEELLQEAGIPRERWKEHVDAMAASLILRAYMNSGEHA